MRFVSNKEFLPDSYTGFKNRIGLTVDEEYVSETKEVVLSFPFKDCVLEGDQRKEDEDRDEIFWNETLAPDEIDRLLEPKVLTNFKQVDSTGAHEATQVQPTENLVIRGNNLLALHCLEKRFAGRVKLIYIDPPYNIGGDGFNYNDRFNHASWLVFMKNRLEAARNLLREDGVIVVQIDDNEVYHLKILMGEIFKSAPSGKSNFVQMVEVKANEGAANEYQNPFMPKICEYLLIYAKNYDKRVYKPIWVKSKVDRAYGKIVLNPQEKDFRKWKIGNVMDEFVKVYGEKNKDNEDLLYEFVFKNIDRIFRLIDPKGAGKGLVEGMEESKKNTWAVYKREDKEDILCYKGAMVRFYSKNLQKDIDGNTVIARELGSLWTDIAWTGIASEGGVKLKGGKKPEKLLRRIIEMSTEPKEIVLDFFSGSGTTAAVAHKMGRQYIAVEQLDYGEDDTAQRLKNVIGGDQSGISKAVGWKGRGSYIYCELMKLNQVFTDEVRKAKSKEDIKKIWKSLGEKAFVSYRVDIKKFDEYAKDFTDLSLHDQKRFLLELLDKNQLYVNLGEIDDADYGVSKEDKKLNAQFYTR